MFSTRPAIYAPLFNWITEFICTAFKVAGVQGIEMQVSLQPGVRSALKPQRDTPLAVGRVSAALRLDGCQPRRHASK